MLALLLILFTFSAFAQEDVDTDTDKCKATEEVEKRLGEVEASLDEQIADARALIEAMKAEQGETTETTEDGVTEFVGPVFEAPIDTDTDSPVDGSTDALDAPSESEVLAVGAVDE
jgi:hypothetical protein